MKKILIISAMADVELNYLIKEIENIKKEETNICKFYIGNLFENQIILCDAGVGLIKTSGALTLAIEKFKPDYIINQGCSGGFSKNIHKGDIVVGVQCINLTSIRTKYKDIGEGYSLNNWELINFIAGEEDRLIAQNAGKNLIELVKKVENLYKDGKIHYGVIGSGDIWNQECDWILHLNKKYNILCEDMEGIAVYTISNLYKIPSIDIRVISDNSILKEKYDRTVSIKAQKFIKNLLKQIK